MDSSTPDGHFWVKLPLIRWIVSRDRITAFSDQAIVSASNIITAILIGRVCSKEDLGLYAAGMSLILISQSVQKAVILTPYTVLNPRLEGSLHRQYKGSMCIHLGGLCVLISSGLLVGSLVTKMHADSDLVSRLLMTLAITAPFIVFREFARQISYAELAFKKAFVFDTSIAVMQFSGLIFLAVAGLLSAYAAFAVMAGSSFLAGIGWFLANRRTLESNLDRAIRHFLSNWELGRWLFASGLFRESSVSLYPWIIITIHGAAEAGLWGAVVGTVAIYNPVTVALFNHEAPRIAHDFASGGTQNLRVSVRKTTIVCAIATAPILLTLLFFGGRLVSLIYGADYAGLGHIVMILAIGVFVSTITLPFPQGLFALSKPAWDFAGNVSSFLMLVTVGWLAVLHLGATGAALGLLAAELAGAVVKVTGFRVSLRRTDS